MGQMALRAQGQPCRCWRGNWPSGGYCLPSPHPHIMYSSLNVLQTLKIENFSTYNYIRGLSPPLCPSFSLSLSLSDLVINMCPLSSAGVQAAYQPPVAPTKAFLRELAQLVGGCALPPEFSETPGDGKSFISS